MGSCTTRLKLCACVRAGTSAKDLYNVWRGIRTRTLARGAGEPVVVTNGVAVVTVCCCSCAFPWQTPTRKPLYRGRGSVAVQGRGQRSILRLSSKIRQILSQKCFFARHTSSLICIAFDRSILNFLFLTQIQAIHAIKNVVIDSERYIPGNPERRSIWTWMTCTWTTVPIQSCRCQQT